MIYNLQANILQPGSILLWRQPVWAANNAGFTCGHITCYSDPNWGVHIAILRDMRACLTAANKYCMQWDNFGWSLRGQTWTNLCWSLCLRHVEVCCTFLTYYWTCEDIWSSHTFCCLTKCRANYLREFSHMLQSGMLCGHWLQVVAVF
jgi:hypothetical protein